MSVTSHLRDIGYCDREIHLYGRLGPKSRAIIFNMPKKIDIVMVLRMFHLQRKCPDPIEIGGELFPQPLPSVYNSVDGDNELATWLLVNSKSAILPAVEFFPSTLPPLPQRILAKFEDEGEPTPVKNPAFDRNIDL